MTREYFNRYGANKTKHIKDCQMGLVVNKRSITFY